jgi:hypothetical protein
MVEGPSAGKRHTGRGDWSACHMLSMLIYMINLDVLAHVVSKFTSSEGQRREGTPQSTSWTQKVAASLHLFLNNNRP